MTSPYPWNRGVTAESEEESDRLFGRLNNDFRDFPQVLAYVKTTWMTSIKNNLSHVGQMQ